MLSDPTLKTATGIAARQRHFAQDLSVGLRGAGEFVGWLGRIVWAEINEL